MNNISQEYEQKDLENFIRTFLSGIIKGANDVKDAKFDIEGAIEFELAVVTRKEKGGKIKIYIADVGGNYSQEKISKIRFKIREHKKHYFPHGEDNREFKEPKVK